MNLNDDYKNPAHLLRQVKVPAPGPPFATVPVLGRITTATPTLAGAAEFY